jgi:hypothetical protein
MKRTIVAVVLVVIVVVAGYQWNLSIMATAKALTPLYPSTKIRRATFVDYLSWKTNRDDRSPFSFRAACTTESAS